MKDSYYIALGLVGNHDDALELSQEAFYRAYKNLSMLSPDRKFFPWFYQILRNLCFSHLRKARLRRAASLDDCENHPIQLEDNAGFTPDTLAEKTELKKNVWLAIGRLSEKHREVIILRHFRTMSYDQIASALFCSKGSVMSRLYHARKKLKEILESMEGGLNYDLRKL